MRYYLLSTICLLGLLLFSTLIRDRSPQTFLLLTLEPTSISPSPLTHPPTQVGTDVATSIGRPTAALLPNDSRLDSLTKSEADRGPRLHVVQVDTRDPNAQVRDDNEEHILSIRYTQHICQQKGWNYTFVDVKDFCPYPVPELKLCGKRNQAFSPTWLKVLAIWFLMEKEISASLLSSSLYRGDTMNDKQKVLSPDRTLFVFIDSDAVLTEASRFVPPALLKGASHTPENPDGVPNGSSWAGSHLWVGRDTFYYGSLCGNIIFTSLPYRTCLSTGLMAVYPTTESRKLFREWWFTQFWKGRTAWEIFNEPSGRRSRIDWPYEQDSMSIMLSFTPLPITIFKYTLDKKKEPNENFPISNVYHTAETGSVNKTKDLLQHIVRNMKKKSPDRPTAHTAQMLLTQENVLLVKPTNIVSLTNALAQELLGLAGSVTSPPLSSDCREYKLMNGQTQNTCEAWEPPTIDWHKWRVKGSVPTSQLKAGGSKSGVACHDTCHGKVPGAYTIGGVNNVYCEDDKALVSLFINTRYSWPRHMFYIESAEIGPQRPGWRPWEGDVQRLAELATHVILHNVDYGTMQSVDHRALSALKDRNGTWHGENKAEPTPPMFTDITDTQGNKTDTWCFSASCPGFLATGWPNMYHSCGFDQCVHWLADRRHLRVAQPYRPYVSLGSATWLAMPPPTGGNCA